MCVGQIQCDVMILIGPIDWSLGFGMWKVTSLEFKIMLKFSRLEDILNLYNFDFFQIDELVYMQFFHNRGNFGSSNF